MSWHADVGETSSEVECLQPCESARQFGRPERFNPIVRQQHLDPLHWNLTDTALVLVDVLVTRVFQLHVYKRQPRSMH